MNKFYSKFLKSENGGVSVVEFAIIYPILLLMFLGVVEYSRFTLINQKVALTAYTLGDMITQMDPAGCDDVEYCSHCNLKPGMFTISELNKIFNTIPSLMSPYPSPNTAVIISSVHKTDLSKTPMSKLLVPASNNGSIILRWQESYGSIPMKAIAEANSEVESARRTGHPLLRRQATFKKNKAGAFTCSWLATNPLVPNNRHVYVADTDVHEIPAGSFANKLNLEMDENVIIVEVFFDYSPIIFGTGLGLAKQTIKHSAYFMPRNGKLLWVPED